MSSSHDRGSSRVKAIAIGAVVQLVVSLLVALLWHLTKGHWGPGAWVAYLGTFGLGAPIAGLYLADRVGQWKFSRRQFVTSATLLVILNLVFALMSPGLAEGGVNPLWSEAAYCVLLVALFAVFSTQKGARVQV